MIKIYKYCCFSKIFCKAKTHWLSLMFFVFLNFFKAKLHWCDFEKKLNHVFASNIGAQIVFFKNKNNWITSENGCSFYRFLAFFNFSLVILRRLWFDPSVGISHKKEGGVQANSSKIKLCFILFFISFAFISARKIEKTKIITPS